MTVAAKGHVAASRPGLFCRSQALLTGSTSQKLMRLRVLLQFVAIVIIMATVWAMAK
jgi:hypothetical protein